MKIALRACSLHRWHRGIHEFGVFFVIARMWNGRKVLVISHDAISSALAVLGPPDLLSGRAAPRVQVFPLYAHSTPSRPIQCQALLDSRARSRCGIGAAVDRKRRGKKDMA